MITAKDREKIVKGITNYLTNGYLYFDSFDDPTGEVIDCLNVLLSMGEIETAEECCKKTLETNHVDSQFFRAVCLNNLLLSEKEWLYAFNYLLNKTERVSIPELEKALFYFSCAKNETDPHPIPDGLFKQLTERYQMVKDESDANFYHLHEAYNDFIKAYSLYT